MTAAAPHGKTPPPPSLVRSRRSPSDGFRYIKMRGGYLGLAAVMALSGFVGYLFGAVS